MFELLKWVAGLWHGQMRKRSLFIASLSKEMDRLAELMDEVLNITNEIGEIVDPIRATDVSRMCKRNRNRMITLIESSAYNYLDQDLQNEFEKRLNVVHYAPGSVVGSIAMLETGLNDGRIPIETRGEFRSAIDNIRELAVKIRLREAIN